MTFQKIYGSQPNGAEMRWGSRAAERVQRGAWRQQPWTWLELWAAAAAVVVSGVVPCRVLPMRSS